MAQVLLQTAAPATNSYEGPAPEYLMVILTQKDWAEIYYALDTKLLTVKSSFYREDRSGENAAWIAHLNRIKHRIGPDGKFAAGEGVTGK